MLALAFMMTLVGMFALGRLVGRDESLRHMLRYIKHMYSDMSPEDKQNFDRMVREYRDKWYPENKR
jgi:hypothetical protein